MSKLKKKSPIISKFISKEITEVYEKYRKLTKLEVMLEINLEEVKELSVIGEYNRTTAVFVYYKKLWVKI